MWNLMLALALGIAAAASELPVLWRQRRKKECVAYLLLESAGLAILGMYLLWENVPTIHALLSSFVGER